MKKISVLFTLAAVVACSGRMSDYDMNAPVGWAASTDDGSYYEMTGGGKGRTIVLSNKGDVIDDALQDAVENYDVIVLNGADGDFLVRTTRYFKGLSGKTIVGINGAVLRTEFQFTEDLKKAVAENDFSGLDSSSGTGGVLTNGCKVNELREFVQRQFFIDYLNDPEESYRNAGIFIFDQCSNIIVRNIAFEGPGSMDVGGNSLLSLSSRSLSQGSTYIWVDHCSFTDAQRTNVGIGGNSDHISFTWCIFRYTEKSTNHNYSTLIGGWDSDYICRGHLKVTFADCIWGEGIGARTPMCRFGVIHILNNYYCTQDANGINPRKESTYLIEGSYFDKGVAPLSKYAWDVSAPAAYDWKDNYFVDDYVTESLGEVTMPYEYICMPAEMVKEELLGQHGAGPNLRNPFKIGK